VHMSKYLRCRSSRDISSSLFHAQACDRSVSGSEVGFKNDSRAC